MILQDDVQKYRAFIEYGIFFPSMTDLHLRIFCIIDNKVIKVSNTKNKYVTFILKDLKLMQKICTTSWSSTLSRSQRQSFYFSVQMFCSSSFSYKICPKLQISEFFRIFLRLKTNTTNFLKFCSKYRENLLRLYL